jgi:hypothetical protein
MHIQVQVNWDDKSILRLIDVLMRSMETKDIHIHKGPIRQKYINIGILTSSVQKDWDHLKETFHRNKTLREHSIVVSEGKHGWDDYELIYHWDPKQIDQRWKLPLRKSSSSGSPILNPEP